MEKEKIDAQKEQDEIDGARKIAVKINSMIFSTLTNPYNRPGTTSLVPVQRGTNFLQTVTRNLALGAFQTCSNVVLNAITQWCYKKNSDAGTIPTNCSSGWFRYGSLCYQNCKLGYTFVLGVCWQNCPSDYTDMGLYCVKSNWFWSDYKGKVSYIPSFITNFDSSVTCESGKYKPLSFALCYRDFARI